MYNGEFVLRSEYESSGVDLNGLKSAMELEIAARTLAKYGEEGETQELGADGTVLFSDLEDGVYLLRSCESEKSEMRPTLVFVPAWIEGEDVLSNEITVIPKMIEKPDTGDAGWSSVAVPFAFSLAAIFLILFRGKHLRKRKNCDTMQ